MRRKPIFNFQLSTLHFQFSIVKTFNSQLSTIMNQLLNEIVLPTLAAVSTGGNALQFLYARSLKRAKAAEADIKEIESLRMIIELNRQEIERMHARQLELEAKYTRLQHEYTALAEKIRRLS